MKNIIIIVLLLAKVTIALSQTKHLELKKAIGHPIQYYISLPDHWTVAKKWPVVITVEDADKQFKQNAERFIAARKDLPFIIVVPINTTNGQQGHKDSTIYPYSKAVWDTIYSTSICKFDIEGLQQIIQDVKSNYSGSDKVFITGFEAGTHLVWAMVFQHPELLCAAAPVAGNFRNRCMENDQFSTDRSLVELPIRNFTGTADNDFGSKGYLYSQYLEAKNLAVAHGYKNITESKIPGKGHEPMPREVLEYFFSVWKLIR